MSLERKPVVCRLSDDAMRALELLCAIENKDFGEKGREILERALLGEVHGAKVAVSRFTHAAKLVTKGKSGELDL